MGLAAARGWGTGNGLPYAEVTAAMPIVAAPAAIHQSRTAPVLRIDLAAIRANYRELRRRYSGTTLAAVVKSNAYGLGIEAVAPSLVAEGCKHFWVNDIDEAARLRSVSSDATVYCLMGLAGGAVRDFDFVKAIPALTSLAEIRECSRYALQCGRPLAVAIQLDTGLGRLGLSVKEAEHLAANQHLLVGLDIRLYLSQLASYNIPSDPGNLEQNKEMRRLCALLPAAPISLGASSAVFMENGWHFDMARVGSALFGVQTSSSFQDGLIPCYRLSAPILGITEHPAERHLGYRGATKLNRPSRIATVAIGYANGLPQGFAGIGSASVLGKSAAIIGGIAMNMTMIDVTDLPADQPREGDEAIFLSEGMEIEPIAESLGIAPNVVLTQVGAGTRKLYVNR